MPPRRPMQNMIMALSEQIDLRDRRGFLGLSSTCAVIGVSFQLDGSGPVTIVPTGSSQADSLRQRHGLKHSEHKGPLRATYRVCRPEWLASTVFYGGELRRCPDRIVRRCYINLLASEIAIPTRAMVVPMHNLITSGLIGDMLVLKGDFRAIRSVSVANWSYAFPVLAVAMSTE